MSTTTPNKNTALAQHQKVIAGVEKYFGKAKSLSVAGTDYTPKTLKAVFQADIDATNTVDESRAQLKQQVATGRVVRAKARTARKALRNIILGNYGEAAVQMLEDFGIPMPKTTGRKTAKAKAEAVVKAEATRKARHTMGPKQRLKVTGATEAAQAETPATSVAPTEAATPAAVATAAASNASSHS